MSQIKRVCVWGGGIARQERVLYPYPPANFHLQIVPHLIFILKLGFRQLQLQLHNPGWGKTACGKGEFAGENW